MIRQFLWSSELHKTQRTLGEKSVLTHFWKCGVMELADMMHTRQLGQRRIVVTKGVSINIGQLGNAVEVVTPLIK